MPEYIYRCPECQNEVTVAESMLAESQIYCSECDEQMRRKPLWMRVNWGGLRPSQGELHPNIKREIAAAERSREEMIPHVSKNFSRRFGTGR